MTKAETMNRRRVLVILLVFALAFVLLAGRLVYLQVFESSMLRQKSQEDRERGITIFPKRGTIYDRNMNILAKSASAWTVALRPKTIKSEKNASLIADKLSAILGMDRAVVLEKANKNSTEVWLKRQITDAQYAQIKALQLDNKGVILVEDTKRYYPMGSMLEQVLGYTDIDGVGREGLEAKYDKYLAGTPGQQLVETDASGYELWNSESGRIPPTDGIGLVSTVDYMIQGFMEKAVEECYNTTKPKRVMCIAMDPKTGDILGMVNYPSYDLNNPPRSDVKTFVELSRNNAILDVYEPGSTFKVFTTAAAIEEKKAVLTTRYFCAGFKMVDGQKIKCWRVGRPHGPQNLTEAVCNSCNPAFMDMALLMGKDTFYDYLGAFGFGQYTKVDFSSDEKGIVMPNKYVKNVDLARMSFGQTIAVTPLQLITGFCSVINGGTLMQPRLVKELVDADGSTIKEMHPVKVDTVISATTSATMRDILEAVVTKGGGKNAYIPGYRVGGKTGTAQKYENGKVVHDKHVSSFIGFAPANDPKIVVLMVVDEPGVPIHFGSIVAAPFVKNILSDSLRYMNVPLQNLNGDVANNQETITMPDVSHMNVEAAEALLKGKGLYVYSTGTGNVTAQSPAAGEKLSANAPVAIKGGSDNVEDAFAYSDD